jgi:hypothetical protein
LTSLPLASRLNTVLIPDPRRVIAELFVPGEDAAVVHARARALADRIAALDQEQVGHLLQETIARFNSRHRDLQGTWRHHYDLVHHRVDRASELSTAARLLVGAYFTHEYAVEAAALYG